MTPEEFKSKLIKLKKESLYPSITNGRIYFDAEGFHVEADDLMCEILESLGYKEGIEIFKNTEKWYS